MADLPIIGWRLWYSDGSNVESTQMSWADAPDQDVQVLEWLHEPPYRTLTYGIDQYTLPGETAIKYGGWMDETLFDELVAKLL